MSDLPDVDVSIPDVIELDVGAIGLEHQSGPGVVGVDVPIVTVSGLPPPIGSQALEPSGNADGQSGAGSSPCCRVSHGGHASMEPSIDQRRHSPTLTGGRPLLTQQVH